MWPKTIPFGHLRETRSAAQGKGPATSLRYKITPIRAGPYFDWRLSLLGVVLGAAAACALLIHEFFWLLLIPALVVGIIAVVWRK